MSVTFVTKTCTNVTAIKQKRLTINILQKSLVTFGTYFCTKVTGLDRTGQKNRQGNRQETGQENRTGEGEGKEGEGDEGERDEGEEK